MRALLALEGEMGTHAFALERCLFAVLAAILTFRIELWHVYEDLECFQIMCCSSIHRRLMMLMMGAERMPG